MRYLWWETCYTEALIETDQNLKLARIDEAIAAIALRLLSPVDAESEEDVNIKAAQIALARLKAELGTSRSRAAGA